jgi:hypothetical protein
LADRWLVPASVELFQAGDSRSRLSVLWTNGQRGKLDGRADEIRGVQTILLQAMSDQSNVNVGQWPAMKVGSGMEWNW